MVIMCGMFRFCIVVTSKSTMRIYVQDFASLIPVKQLTLPLGPLLFKHYYLGLSKSTRQLKDVYNVSKRLQILACSRDHMYRLNFSNENLGVCSMYFVFFFHSRTQFCANKLSFL